MDYAEVDFKDLIDMSHAPNLEHIIWRIGQTSPLWTENSVCSDDAPVKDPPFVPLDLPCIPSSYTLPPCAATSKKRKNVKTSTSSIHAMDLDDFELDEVILKDDVVLNNPIFYFDKGVFGWLELKRDLYSHFKSDAKQTRVREARRVSQASNGEMMADGLLEVTYIPLEFVYVILYLPHHFHSAFTFYCFNTWIISCFGIGQRGRALPQGLQTLQEGHLLIARHQKSVEDRDALLLENEAKILRLKDMSWTNLKS